MNQTFSLRRFFLVILAIFALTSVMSGQATQSGFSGKWERHAANDLDEYLDLRADGTYTLRDSFIVLHDRRSRYVFGNWTIRNVKAELVWLDGHTYHDPRDPIDNDRVQILVNLNEWTRR